MPVYTGADGIVGPLCSLPAELIIISRGATIKELKAIMLSRSPGVLPPQTVGGMEFLRLVEDDLRAVSVEARKKHPMVKEAAERGIVKLRGLREQYAAAVRESGESPPISMLRSQDLLRPFLLALNHSDCSRAMVLQALAALQRLINRSAISPGDAPNILRVLSIQAIASSSTQEVQVKVLQTLLLTVTWRSCELPEDSLASALAVCIQLSEQRNATVKNAASATLRQVISLMFDRVGARDVEDEEDERERGHASSSPLRAQEEDDEDDEEEDLEWSSQGQIRRLEAQQRAQARRGEPEGLRMLRSVERCAYYLLQDLCLLSRGESGTWLKHVAVPQTMGLELIEQILVHKPALFRDKAVFTDVVRNQVCPLVVQTLKSGLDFPLLVRLMRTVNTVVAELTDLLVPQCEVILTMLTQLITACELGTSSSSLTGGVSSLTSSPFIQSAAEGVVSLSGFTSHSRASKLGLWSVLLALDVVSTVCHDGWLLHTVFRNYDLLPDCTNIFATLVKALTRFVMEGCAHVGASLSLHSMANSVAWSSKGLANLTRGFELLKETAPPPISDGEILLSALVCLLALLDSLSRLMIEAQLEGTLPSPVPCAALWLPGVGQEGSTPGYLYHRMLVKGDTWRDLLQFLSTMFSSQSAGSEALFDACLLGFERLALTVHLVGVAAAKPQVVALACKLAVPAGSLESSQGSLSSIGNSLAALTTLGVLTSRHVRATRCLLRLVGVLGNALGESWDTVVESLDLLEAMVGRSSPTSGLSTTGGGGSGALGGDGGLEDLRMALRRFGTFTMLLEDAALAHVTRACTTHAQALMQAEQSSGFKPASDGGSLDSAMTPGGQGAGGSAGPSLTTGATALLSTSRAAETDLGPSRSLTCAAFMIRQLVVIAMFNISRAEVIWAVVQDYLVSVACGARSPLLRSYAVNALADLVIKALLRGSDELGAANERLDSSMGYHATIADVPGAVLGCLPDLDAVFNVQGELDWMAGRRRRGSSSSAAQPSPCRARQADDKQLMLLKTLQDLGSAAYLDTRQQALAAFFRVLQSGGHVLESGWLCSFDLLRSVAQAGGPSGGSEELSIDVSASSSASVSEADEVLLLSGSSRWGESCLPLAFQTLKLIMDEHLDGVPHRYLPHCIACMGSFGAQLVDVNVSLTSIGMVWTVADFVTAKQGGAKGAAAWGAEEEAIWDAIFTELGKLWLDGRPEVRNCAINTLFSCVVGHGVAFPMVSWRARIDAILALFKSVEDRARGQQEMERASRSLRQQQNSKKSSAMKVVIHHSRDTASKQWSETRVLALQGMGRVHRAFMRHLRSQQWYPSVWSRTLEAAKAVVLMDSGNTEVTLAAVSLLFTMLQLSSKAGLAHGPLRAAVGMKVVDGALQQVTEAVGPRAGTAGEGKSVADNEAYEASKVALWEETWVAVQEAVGYPEDEEGEIAAAFLTNLQATYESSREVELRSVPRMLTFLRLVQTIAEPRSSRTRDLSNAEDRSSHRRAAWRPPVLNCQRELLNLLKQIQSDLPEVWEFVFTLLTHYAVQLIKPAAEASEEGQGLSSAEGGNLRKLGYVRLPVSKQFAREAADCLAQLYAQEQAPRAAKAMAFVTVLRALGSHCLHCAKERRRVTRARWVVLLDLYASRSEGAPALVTHQELQVLVDGGSLLVPILQHGLCALREEVEEQEQKQKQGRGAMPGLMQRWAEALLMAEGYLIPWLLEEHSSSNRALAGQECGDEEGLAVVENDEYVKVAKQLLDALLTACVASLEAALRARVVHFLADLLADVLLAQASVMGGAAGGRRSEDREGGGKSGSTGTPSLEVLRAVIVNVKELLQALLSKAEQSAGAVRGETVEAIRHLVTRLLHASSWVLKRYQCESRCTDAPTDAYLVAEAHALLVLDLLQAIRLPAWALPPPPVNLEQDGPPGWIDPSSLVGSTSKAAKGVKEEPLDTLRVGDSGLFSGHVLLLCPVILGCVATGSSAVRAAVTSALGGAEVAQVFDALRQETRSQRALLGSLQAELGVRRSVSSGFFSST